MTLLRRMTRFLKADLHGLLDGIEEPQEMVKQTIRDMEEALEHKTQTLALLQSRLHRLQSDRQEGERATQEIDHHIDLCFDAGNDALARSFIRKRLVAIQQSRQLERVLEETQKQCVTLEQTIQEQRRQLAAVVQQLNLYTAQSDTTYAPGCSEAGVSEDEVEVAFLEERRRRARQSQTTV